MKAGLFVCDHTPDQYLDQFGDMSDMFEALFPELKFELYDVCNGHFPESIDACDVYMATGSRRSAYDEIDWIVRLKETIRQIYQSDKFFVGFCFGHQLMGEALGGKVTKAPTGWSIGVHTFQVSNQQRWMEPALESLNLLMMCGDQVVKLPKDTILLAGNEHCPVGMFQVGTNMLGIQAHPEFSKAYERILIEERVAIFGEALTQKGLASLDKPLHRTAVRQWILNFIGMGK